MVIRPWPGGAPAGTCATSHNPAKDPALSPDPTTVHPLPAHESAMFLNPLVTSPNITVGECTYYDDPDVATDFEHRNVLCAYGPERLGCGVAPEAEGHGYATEALGALLHHGFAGTRARRVIAGTPHDNVASQRALEKVGLRRTFSHDNLHYYAIEG